MNILSLQIELFLLIAIGAVTEKCGLIGTSGRKTLSNLLIYVILPCNILHSYTNLVDIPEEFVRECVVLFILSLVIHVASVLGGKLFFLKYSKKQQSVLAYGLLCSNSGFIGLPVVEALFGSLGVMYASVYMIPLRFTMWTIGIALFTPITKKDAFFKVATNPCIICTFVGFALLACPVKLPDFLTNTLQAGSRCVLPISMFVIGSILASVPMRALFSKSVLYFTAIRLLIFPGLVFLFLRPFRLNEILVGICMLMSGMPAGSMTSILANKYDGDVEFASHIIFTSTLLSTITVPVWMMLVHYYF